ncbi:hypothetical protein KAR91_09590 [Candidatus Pacearchaeota archaeon]|nr:hypothetical protein [Candidatus Pacearchaeota archaeon]
MLVQDARILDLYGKPIKASNPFPVGLKDGGGNDTGVGTSPLVTKDHADAVAHGEVPGAYSVTVSAFQPAVTDVLDDLNEFGQEVIPIPRIPIVMEFKSDDPQDTAGTEVSAGVVTASSLTALIDSAATFVTDGVVVGDTVFLDTTAHRDALVTVVVSETELTVDTLNINQSEVGDEYSVRTGVGAGATRVDIHILREGFVEDIVVQFTNGITPVPISGSVLRVNNFDVLNTGSNLVSVGNLDIREVGIAAPLYCRVAAGGNKSLQGLFTIPAGKIGTVEGWNPSMETTAKNSYARMFFRATVEWSNRVLIPHVFHFESISLSSGWQAFTPHMKFPAGCDIKISSQRIKGSADIASACNFSVVIERES